MTTALPAPPQTPVRSAKHNDALDGVRGIAILLVLITHAGWFFRTYPTAWYFFPIHVGWVGVDLFFVLSGYLITGILIRTRHARNRVQSFYMRRVLRIFPLYYGVLLAVFIGVHFSVWLREQIPMHTWRGWIIYVAYLQNWALLHNPNFWLHNLIGHFWSLAIEEQFYFVWPWLVWSLSTRWIVRLSVVGMIASLALRLVFLWHSPEQPLYPFGLTPCRGEGLLMGAALAAYIAEFGSLPKRALAGMALAGIAIIAAILISIPYAFIPDHANVPKYGIGITAFNLVFGALIASTQYSIRFLTAWLNAGWLRSFGKYSYGIYVYHAIVYSAAFHLISRAGYPTAMRARYAIAFLLVNVAIVYGVAWLSFNYFESYFLHLKDRFRPRITEPVARPMTAKAAGQC